MLRDIELDRQVLGLNAPWTVMRVDLKVKEQWVNGFRNRDNFRTAFYFQCSGLDLYLDPTH